jgi:predicted MFS family arabinose efflux permease
MTAPAGSIRSALAHRSFRRLLFALGASQGGDWLYNVGLLAFVFERTHSTGWLSATTAIRVLPIVLLGPLGGVVADRFDRRRTMIVCDVVRVGLMCALVVVATSGLPTVLAPILAGLATAVSAPYPSCTAASVRGLVPDADVPGANAARAVIGPVCIVAGPALGAVLLLVAPIWVVFAVNAGTFLISALAVSSIAAGPAFRAPGTGERDHLLAEIAEGARALWNSGIALQLVSADLLCSFLYGVETVALVLISARLGLSAQGYGLLVALIGIGGVAGSALATRVARIRQVPAVIAVLLIAAAVAVGVLPLTSSLIAALLLALVMGAASTLVEVLTETALQRSLDDAVFGRAYGFAFPASIGGIVLGAAVAAPLITWCGLSAAMLLVATFVTAYAVGLVVVSHRRAGRSPNAAPHAGQSMINLLLAADAPASR